MAMEASLGTLLKFDGQKKSTKTGRQFSGDAQILMFTGVRYERGTSSPGTSDLDTKRRKRKRG